VIEPEQPGSLDWASAREGGELSDELTELIPQVAAAIRRAMQGPDGSSHFRAWEEQGLHITPVSFYEPVPDVRLLQEGLWIRPSPLQGIDMNEAAQIHLVSEVFPQWVDEFSDIPDQRRGEDAFFLGNGMFDGTDALAYYCLIRHLQPSQIIEVGTGFSTALAVRALKKNGRGDIIAIDPYPSTKTLVLSDRLTELIISPVQEVDPEIFTRLSTGDILFIDSSHVSRIGSDVNYLVLEVLPRLPGGVLVHFHDIFLPLDYPKDWVLEKRRFWTEQYLLQAFLAFNSEYEVFLANSFLGMKHQDVLKSTFPTSPWWGGGSFWIRRRSS
jgi:hypothetical protein